MNAITVSGLTIRLAGHGRAIISDVSLTVARGEVLGLIGESGAGKSTTARALLGLFPPGSHLEGTVSVGDLEITALGSRALRDYRSRKIALIAQDPRASVNPMHGLDVFLTESLRANRKLSRAQARERAADALRQVGLDPQKVLGSYPHQVSGGMLQRVVIAAGIAMRPSYLIADEPSTALDVTSQAAVIAVLKHLADTAGLTLVLVTHNIELAASICDRLVVMKSGRVLESGTIEQVLHSPQGDYTRELITATRAVSEGIASGVEFPGLRGALNA